MNRENPRLFTNYVRVKYPGLAVHIPRHGRALAVAARRR
jgi:hypothetical protein